MRRPRALYAALLAMRVLLALSPSYIHPDEFFQAPEVAASDILGVDGVRTWEFTGANPIRSIVPIYGYSGTPFILLRAVCAALRLTGLVKADAAQQPSTLAVFWAQRLFMACLSLVVDWCVYRVIARRYPGARMLPTMLVLASSHCLVVFHTRPFGNAVASVLLALGFDLVSQIECALAQQQRPSPLLRLRQPFCLLAVVGVVGVFSHVTFAPFFLPLALVAGTMVVSSAWRGTVTVAHALVTLALGTGCAALTALGLVLADSVYYGTVRHDSRAVFGVSGTLTCTVVNNFRYNSNAANLAAHGLHARYMHLAVSMPLLFGPLYLLAVAKLWASVKRISRCFCTSSTTTGAKYSSSSSSSASPRSNGGGGGGCEAVDFTMLSACLSVVVGVLALSLARHQEPRFLLPALPGIILFTWRWHRLLPAYFWQLWVVYNLAVAGIFGGVHQAGVVPVVKYLADTSVARELGCVPLNLPNGGDNVVCAHTTNRRSSASDDSLALAFPRLKTNVLLYATYLAPRHLLVQNKQHRQLQARVAMTDLVSMDGGQVQAVLRASVLVRCLADPAADAQRMMVFARPSSSSSSSPTQDTARREAAEYERTLLVVPASTDLSSLLPANHSSSPSPFELRLLYSYAPHVNFDHIQTVLNGPFSAASLDVYLVCGG
ncbi:alpha 1,2 mannosyltransferase [Coemansia sp. RSA 1939]|nr:alpha 1,2 mannosyltransferase [Coemansia sp. RSA 1939]KAJ2613698.1 alpha 1,2 mannosyltransferase [Coemansia sp. RSA 1804]KAJ2693017.1 alpha 1,2 mannosyltransferase [Coemansia sp. RSA 1285]